MPSLILDPVMNAISYLWQGAVKMDGGDWAGWAQLGGTLLAMYFAWRQGNRGQKRRDDEEAEQRLIHYKIAEDIYRDVIEWRVRVIAALKDGSAKGIFEGGVIDYVEADLEILEKLLVLRLPNDRCAKDVQVMREYGVGTRFDLLRARDEMEATGWENGRRSLHVLLERGRRCVSYAYIERKETGPLDGTIVDGKSRWTEKSRTNLRLIEKLQAELGIIDQ